MLTPVSYNKQVNFGVNLNSPKLRLSQEDFFIKINGYGKNKRWASLIKNVTDEVAVMIRQNTGSEKVLQEITEGVKFANLYPLDFFLRMHTGILRTTREGWECESDWKGLDFETPYILNKYRPYKNRLRDVAKNPLKNPYKDIKIATIDNYSISHPKGKYINNVFKHIEKIYNSIQDKYIKQEVSPADINDVNEKIAEIRWILAHAMPWERGSDCISNVFMRALYKAIGIKAYPPAKGISFDLEAFCTNLNEYKKNFSKYFEKAPEVVE